MGELVKIDDQYFSALTKNNEVLVRVGQVPYGHPVVGISTIRGNNLGEVSFEIKDNQYQTHIVIYREKKNYNLNLSALDVEGGHINFKLSAIDDSPREKLA